ncbi:unnamed protein product [Spirodela intermedia]|uniref:Uncharacterized protein n=1 Tax=Spirodela intermedia TaxID=51605 RepID=A0A7I8J5G3_SPIIN|nr:unnamed protein product [Spirodela intermedia]CAA6665005.1 unnamed protein product [Spirodela intermedia]
MGGADPPVFPRRATARSSRSASRDDAEGRRPRRTPAEQGISQCCAPLLGARHRGAERRLPVHRRHTETSLIDFYGRCGFLQDARLVFDRMPDKDVVTYTAMLSAHADRDGFEHEMTALFREMLCCGVEPNAHTLTTVLRRVTLPQGRQIHCHAVKRNLQSDAYTGNALVDMYVKHGAVDWAERVFAGISNKDTACFNSLLTGRGRRGSATGLVAAFLDMGLAGLVGTQATYVSLLNGSAALGLPSLPEQLHAQVVVNGFVSDQMVQGALLDAYAKSGYLEAACAVFSQLGGAGANVVPWNSMISAYGKHGRGREALEVFRQMEAAGARPDYITFTCLLSACSHSGLVEEGWRLFKLMVDAYRIPLRDEHYCCVWTCWFILALNHKVDASVWGALLNSCRIWGDVHVAEAAAERLFELEPHSSGSLFELEPHSSGSYMALAAIYAAHGRWGDAAAVRALMKQRGVKKTVGRSWTETDSVVHNFRSGSLPASRITAELKPHHCRQSKLEFMHLGHGIK